MFELVKNTLQIIAKISLSKCVYLLRINNSGYEVLTIFGDSADGYDEFNSEVSDHFKSEKIDFENLQQIESFNQLKESNQINSLFIQELVSYREKNEAIYIVLLSSVTNQFTSECRERVVSVLSILSNQVKNWLAKDSLPGNEILKSNTNESNGNELELLNGWEENFNKLVEVSGDLIFLLDKSGKILMVNEPGAQLLDFSTDELKGKHLTDLIDNDFGLSVSKSIKDALKNNKVVSFDVDLAGKYERKISFEINCRTIVKDNMVIGLLGFARNVSKQKNFEVEIKKLKPKIIEANRLVTLERARTYQQRSLIEELNRLKSEFVSNISHEFRTPLASIIGFSETIDSDPDLPIEMKKEFNNVILNEGKRLAKLINDVLDLSDIEGGKISIMREDIDVMNVLASVVKVAKGQAFEKNVDLSFDHPNEKIMIKADKQRITQVFNALMDNAIKFTNEYGRIRVIVNNLFGEFEVIISDTGVGISENDLPYIFQQFYRGNRSGFETHGTGVGLVFVKQIVDLHKGLIMVQSEVGSGSTFMLKLPKISNIEKN
jgi:PAS domain S-box-containing protein